MTKTQGTQYEAEPDKEMQENAQRTAEQEKAAAESDAPAQTDAASDEDIQKQQEENTQQAQQEEQKVQQEQQQLREEAVQEQGGEGPTQEGMDKLLRDGSAEQAPSANGGNVE